MLVGCMGVQDKMPPDKMPPTVDFIFLFFKCFFQFLVACTQCSSNLREKKEKSNERLLQIFIRNTKHHAETRTRVKQINEFNAVK